MTFGKKEAVAPVNRPPKLIDHKVLPPELLGECVLSIAQIPTVYPLGAAYFHEPRQDSRQVRLENHIVLEIQNPARFRIGQVF